MTRSKIIKNIEVRKEPSYLTEAANILVGYLTWKDEGEKKNFSFYDRSFTTNKKGKVSFAYLVDRYPKMEDYVNFIIEVRKDSKPYLDEFFARGNEDLKDLYRIHRNDNKNEFSFLLSLLTSFGIDKFEEISKEDFHFQTKMIFLMFVDTSLLDPYAVADISRFMMEKEFATYDLVDLMLKSTNTAEESMALFKALYGWEDIYDRLKPLLRKLEEIIEKNFPMVEERYMNKIKEYADSDFDFAYKLLEDVGFNDMKIKNQFVGFFHINLFNPNSVTIRSIFLDTSMVEMSFGLMIDDYYENEEDKFSDSLNQDRLRAFSDPTRFEIIKLLQKKNYYVKEMADILYLTPATLSYHLNQLQIAGFIGLYYEGRKSYYYLREDTIRNLGDYLHNFADNIEEGGGNEED